MKTKFLALIKGIRKPKQKTVINLSEKEMELIQNALASYNNLLKKRATLSVTWEDQQFFWSKKQEKVSALLSKLQFGNDISINISEEASK